MTWWEAIVLGFVEGVTEYLPISSTGHLILVSSLLGLDDPARRASVDAFNIVIQGGAILAVLGLYRARVGQMLRGLFGADTDGRRLLGNLLLAFLPAALLGPLLDDWIETHLFHAVPVLAALFLGGVWMIWLDRRGARGEGSLAIDRLAPKQRTRDRPLPVRRHVAWNLALDDDDRGRHAPRPARRATRRSSRSCSALPTLGGACAYKLAKNLLHAHQTGAPNLIEQLGAASVALGFGVATLSAALAVSWLVAFLQRHGLALFGWYRIALAALLAALVTTGLIQLG